MFHQRPPPSNTFEPPRGFAGQQPAFGTEGPTYDLLTGQTSPSRRGGASVSHDTPWEVPFGGSQAVANRPQSAQRSSFNPLTGEDAIDTESVGGSSTGRGRRSGGQWEAALGSADGIDPLTGMPSPSRRAGTSGTAAITAARIHARADRSRGMGGSEDHGTGRFAHSATAAAGAADFNIFTGAPSETSSRGRSRPGYRGDGPSYEGGAVAGLMAQPSSALPPAVSQAPQHAPFNPQAFALATTDSGAHGRRRHPVDSRDGSGHWGPFGEITPRPQLWAAPREPPAQRRQSSEAGSVADLFGQSESDRWSETSGRSSLGRAEEKRRQQVAEQERARGKPKFNQYSDDGPITQRGPIGPPRDPFALDQIRFNVSAPKRSNQSSFNILTGDGASSVSSGRRSLASRSTDAPFALDTEVQPSQHQMNRIEKLKYEQIERRRQQQQELRQQYQGKFEPSPPPKLAKR